LTLDGYGRLYGGPHVGVGTFGASLMVADVPSLTAPSAGQLNSIISGSSYRISGGDMLGASYSNNSSGSLVGAGLTAPGLSITKGYNAYSGQLFGLPPC